MKEEIDEFISFLMEHKDDERVTIEKDIKYGYKNYWIIFEIDAEPLKKTNNNHWLNIAGRFSIHFDKRNEAIFFKSEHTNIDIPQITFEDKELLEKWCEKIEECIEGDIRRNFRKMVENSLSSCHNKNIHREWKMKKIFDDEDESL